MMEADAGATNRYLTVAFTASLIVHSIVVLALPLLGKDSRSAPLPIAVQLVEISPPANQETPPLEPQPEPRKKRITPPKLISKPEIDTQKSLAGGVKDRAPEAPEAKTEPEKVPSSAETAMSEKTSHKVGPAEGVGGGNNLASSGDLELGVGGSGTDIGVGQGSRGAGSAAKGEGSGTGPAISRSARPAGGYQVKPRYPESARRAGAQGTTVLKLEILASGRVGEVLIEKSAGHRDLDRAAAEAVKKWLFEPARAENTPVAVWVLLPVRFELEEVRSN